jgi:hypothetical protein
MRSRAKRSASCVMNKPRLTSSGTCPSLRASRSTSEVAPTIAACAETVEGIDSGTRRGVSLAAKRVASDRIGPIVSIKNDCRRACGDAAR